MGFRRGDEYYDDDDEYVDDDDDLDEDEELGSSLRGRSNPFRTSGASNLPGRDRSSGVRPSGVGRPNIPGGPRQTSSGSSGSTSPFRTSSGSGLVGRGGSRSGDGNVDKDDLRSRLGGATGSSSGRSSGPFTSSSQSTGGGSRPNIPGGPRQTSTSSSSGSRPNIPGGPRQTSTSSSSGSRPNIPGGPRQTSTSSSSDSRPNIPGGPKKSPGDESGNKKDDDKKSGGGGIGGAFGGLRNRIGGGGSKDDDKKDEKKPAGGGLIGRRPSSQSSDKKDDDKKSGGGGIGGTFGGLRNRVGGGGSKDDDKKDEKKPAGGGLIGRRPTGSPVSQQKKDSGDGGSKAGGFGSLGGVANRFRPGAKKDDDDKKPSSPGGSKPSPFGNRQSSPQSGAQQKASPFGAARGGKKEDKRDNKKGPKTAAASAGGGVVGRLSGIFGGGEKAAKPSRPKASKVPKVQSEGISLDRKLDFVGVGLVFGALIIFFSALSSEQVAISGLHNFLGQLLGWGALGVPIAMFVIGMWLIIRVFGEDAPTVDPIRIGGVVLGYFALLVVFQYVESFNYPPISDAGLQVPWLRTMLETSIGMRSGGGWVGAELYFMLVIGVGEIGGFFLLLFVALISIMLITRLSASEIAIFFVSIYRSFRTGMAQRAAARRAERLATQQAQLAAASDISVSAPEPSALPAAQVQGALPEPAKAELPLEQRGILFRRGGQTLTLEEQVEAEATAPAAPTPQVAVNQSDNGGGGGLFSRFRRGNKAAAPATEAPKVVGIEEKKSDDDTRTGAGRVAAALGGGLLGGLARGRSNDKEIPKVPEPQKPAEQPAPMAQPAAVAAQEKIGAAAITQPQPVASAATASASPTTIGDSSPRLGSLLGKETPSGRPKPAAFGGSGLPRNPVMPKSPTPSPVNGDADDDDDEETLLGTPTKPTASTASPFQSRPKPAFGQTPSPSRPAFPNLDADDDDDDDDEEIGIKRPAVGAPTLQPSRPGARPRPGLGVSPFSDKSEPEKPSVADDDKVDKSEPAKPADKPEEKIAAASASPFAARMDRLNELRGGQTEPKKPVDLSQLGKSSDADEGEKPAVAQPKSPTPAPSLSPKPSPFSKPDQPAASLSPEDMLKGVKPSKPTEQPAAKVETPSAAPKPFEKPAVQQPAAPKVEPIKSTPQQPAAAQFAASQEVASGIRNSSVFGNPDDPDTQKRQGQTQPAAQTSPQRPISQGPTNQSRIQINWRVPEYRTLLASGSEQEFDREHLLKQANVIEETLSSFGAPGRVVEVNTGPVITQFGVEPDYLTSRSGKKSRVKVGAIAQLDKDLQLALGAKSIRIEAPVPGKGYVGIEVPNEEASLVSLRDVMEANSFRKIKSPLAIALGQSVDGSPISADLSSMPHLLIAGTTGSGKSVCVNAIITSILVRNTPDVVKFIMVDPKRVELTGYNGIPHLVAPVVVELERIVGVLKWVTREMDERYRKFSDAGARNIEDYNKHRAENVERMPYIVVIIDELADLMMLAPEETERTITRIAALARATGIHLVIATQRPSVDVVTGLIKANFPARIAFAVAGGVDSRVILDQPGAERLLGKGDMLYLSGDSPAPLRLQGVFVSDMEINNIVRYWKMQALEQPEQRPINILAAAGDPVANEPARDVSQNERVKQQAFWDKISAEAEAKKAASSSEDDGPAEDELYEEAVELVRRLNKASVSLLQRRLRIGYTRAARLIDVMEERGIVGPAKEGSSKPRDVLPAR